MPAPTSGLARVTIRAPRRRLDLAIPHQVPLAELLPEVLRRAGEAERTGPPATPTGGWILRRGDGASLSGATALAQQGVRDGDVLYLVPRNLAWPEPEYDDVVEEIAAGARRHGRSWDVAATRLFCLVASGLVLLTGLGVLLAAASSPMLVGAVAAAATVALLGAGALLSRAAGDGVAGVTTAGLALPYAFAAGALLAGTGPGGLGQLAGAAVLVGSAAMLLAAVIGAVAVGFGLRVFAAGVTAGLLGCVGGALGLALTGAGAAAILIVVLVGVIGVAPTLAVRLGKVPLPVVTAAPDVLAAERRPRPPQVLAAVIRADEILSGSLIGISVVALGCVATLAGAGLAGPLLAGLGSVVLVLRARLFPSVAARLPLLGAGLLGLAGVASVARAGGWFTVAVGLLAAVGLLVTAATAHRRRAGGSPYLGRLADIADVLTVVALAPVVCAVLDLYRFARGWSG